jgi:hypothetical protein
MANFTSLKNPKWANDEQTAIVCLVTLDIFGDEEISFVAANYDPEEHGRVLFQELVDGKHGPIAPKGE